MMWFKKNEWDEGYGYVCKQLHTGEVVVIAGLGRSKKFQAGARAALESIKQLDGDRSHMMGALTAQLDVKQDKITKIEKELFSLRSANASMVLALEAIKVVASEEL